MDFRSFTYPLNALLTIALPIVLAIYLTRRFKMSWYLIWIGAFGFILSQIGHIPFNSLVLGRFQREVLPQLPAGSQLPVIALLAGLSAGLWEEFTRYAVYRWWVKDARTWRKGILLGNGWGGVEAVGVGILALIAYLQLVNLRNLDLSTLGLPAEQLALARAQVNAYWTAPWYDTFLPFIERIFALPIQIALSVLVLQTFTRRQSRWLWLAIGLHTLIDFLAVFGLSTWGVYATEAMAGLFAAFAIAIIFVLRQPEPEPVANVPPPLPELTAPGNIPNLEMTPENLEKTRYN